jgi:hypothetical protein
MDTFGRAVRLERARLALVDPVGEWGAVARLDGPTAADIIETMTAPTREPTAGRRASAVALLDKIGADPTRDRGRVACPAHGGRDRNLAWRVTPEWNVLLTCHSHRCAFADVLAAVGL